MFQHFMVMIKNYFASGRKNRAKKSDVFIIALALSDVMTFLTGPIENFKDFYQLPMPSYVSQIINVIFVAATQAAGWILLCITVERYW